MIILLIHTNFSPPLWGVDKLLKAIELSFNMQLSYEIIWQWSTAHTSRHQAMAHGYRGMLEVTCKTVLAFPRHHALNYTQTVNWINYRYIFPRLSKNYFLLPYWMQAKNSITSWLMLVLIHGICIGSSTTMTKHPKWSGGWKIECDKNSIEVKSGPNDISKNG